MNKKAKNLIKAILIVIFFAVLGSLLIGDALNIWFVEIKKPWYSIPLWSWFVIGGLYYLMAIIILYKLFNQEYSNTVNRILWLTLLMIVYNEFWNYLFFGIQSTFAGFIGLLPFVILVIILFISLLKYKKSIAWILLPYLIWLIYDLFWAYDLWILNK